MTAIWQCDYCKRHLSKDESCVDDMGEFHDNKFEFEFWTYQSDERFVVKVPCHNDICNQCLDSIDKQIKAVMPAILTGILDGMDKKEV